MRANLIPITLAALALGASPATAQEKFENLDRLDSLVAMTVGANLGEPGGPMAPIDRRLRLKPCPQIPTVEGPVFGAAIVKCDAIGWRIRVPLKAGGAVAGPAARTAAAAPPREVHEVVVKRGDPVELVAGGPAFSVSRTMVADEDGAVGDIIRVRADRKEAPVVAQVVQMGLVRAPGFNEY